MQAHAIKNLSPRLPTNARYENYKDKKDSIADKVQMHKKDICFAMALDIHF
jgi:hypothetical protein